MTQWPCMVKPDRSIEKFMDSSRPSTAVVEVLLDGRGKTQLQSALASTQNVIQG